MQTIHITIKEIQYMLSALCTSMPNHDLLTTMDINLEQ